MMSQSQAITFEQQPLFVFPYVELEIPSQHNPTDVTHYWSLIKESLFVGLVEKNSDEETKPALKEKGIISMLSERRQIQQSQKNIDYAFTFGKKLQSGGYPNTEEMAELKMKFPQYVNLGPQAEANIQNVNNLQFKTVRSATFKVTNQNSSIGKQKPNQRFNSVKFNPMQELNASLKQKKMIRQESETYASSPKGSEYQEQSQSMKKTTKTIQQTTQSFSLAAANSYNTIDLKQQRRYKNYTSEFATVRDLNEYWKTDLMVSFLKQQEELNQKKISKMRDQEVPTAKDTIDKKAQFFDQQMKLSNTQNQFAETNKVKKVSQTSVNHVAKTQGQTGLQKAQQTKVSTPSSFAQKTNTQKSIFNSKDLEERKTNSKPQNDIQLYSEKDWESTIQNMQPKQLISQRQRRKLHQEIEKSMQKSSFIDNYQTEADTNQFNASVVSQPYVLISEQDVTNFDCQSQQENFNSTFLPIFATSKSAARNLKDVYKRLDSQMNAFQQQQRNILCAEKIGKERNKRRTTSANSTRRVQPKINDTVSQNYTGGNTSDDYIQK